MLSAPLDGAQSWVQLTLCRRRPKPRGRHKHSCLLCLSDQFRQRLDVHLPHHPPAMHFDRLFTRAERRGNLLVQHSGHYQAQHLVLAAGQRLELCHYLCLFQAVPARKLVLGCPWSFVSCGESAAIEFEAKARSTRRVAVLNIIFLYWSLKQEYSGPPILSWAILRARLGAIPG